MPTFVLKKYNQNDSKPIEKNTEENTSSDENEPEKLTITVVGTISEIVANALHKIMDNKVDIEEVPEENQEAEVKAISTENINTNPLAALESIKQNDVVFIHNQGFKTIAEEWFLTNITNKTSNVFFTLESFIKFVKSKFKIN